ncbi:MAG: hypothetical protein V3S64_16935, partial [bacterium]
LNGFTDWHLPSNWELWAMEWAKLNGVAIPGVTMGTFPSPTFFWSSMEDNALPINAAQVEFNATFDFTYISWVKDSAIANDSMTCVRRVFP